MNISAKIWGSTREIFNHSNVSIDYITVKKGGYCSLHHHIAKFNQFFVYSGKLKIFVFKKDYDLCDITTLEAGQSTIAGPGEKHYFEALEDTKAIEIYFCKNEGSDIVRDNCGGVSGEPEAKPRHSENILEQGMNE